MLPIDETAIKGDDPILYIKNKFAKRGLSITDEQAEVIWALHIKFAINGIRDDFIEAVLYLATNKI